MTSSHVCTVVDYGIGNVFSVMESLSRSGVEAHLTSDHKAIAQAERLILPGVGAYGRAIEKLRLLKLDDAIYSFVQAERPFLGICVGMQLLLDQGHEFGTHNGLGLIEGHVDKIAITSEDGTPIRVPLIGWYKPEPSADGAWEGTPFSSGSDNAFYFVHSYAAQLTNPKHCIASIDLEGNKVTAAIRKNNIMGVQFHPERSAHSGQHFLSNFLNM